MPGPVCLLSWLPAGSHTPQKEARLNCSTYRAAGAAAVMILVAPVHAQQQPSDGGNGETPAAAGSGGEVTEQAPQWEANAALGWQSSSGNSDTTSLNADALVRLRTGRWRHRAEGSLARSSESGNTTTERYAAGAKTQFDFTQYNYVFAVLDYEEDRFGGIQQRFSETAGYGRRLLDSDTLKLDTEIGGGGRQTEFDEVTGTRKENALIARAALEFRWLISEATELSQTLRSESGGTNTFAESVTTLRSQITGHLYWKASFTLKHNSDVAADREQTDRFTAVSLQYEL